MSKNIRTSAAATTTTLKPIIFLRYFCCRVGNAEFRIVATFVNAGL
jgi:hypothetical protein